METEPTNGGDAIVAEIQSRIAKGVDLLDAQLGPNWPMSVDLDDLDLADSYDCILGQLMEGYVNALATLWPDSPIDDRPRAWHCQVCHGDQAEFEAANPPVPEGTTTRWQLGQAHGFDSDSDAGIITSELHDAWDSTIRRLRQERSGEAA